MNGWRGEPHPDGAFTYANSLSDLLLLADPLKLLLLTVCAGKPPSLPPQFTAIKADSNSFTTVAIEAAGHAVMRLPMS